MAIILKPFDTEFQPFIEEINAKESVIRECADAATMERIRSMILPTYDAGYIKSRSNGGVQTSKVTFRILCYS